MRVLCSCSPAYGHFHPMVPLARALLDAGHDVAFATAREFCARIEKSGFRAHPAGMELALRDERLALLLVEMEKIAPPDRAAFGFTRIFAEIQAPAMLPDLVSLLRSERPDLLIHDASELAGPIAATLVGIPYVNHSFGHLIPRNILERATALLAPLWQASGEPAPPLSGAYRHLYLDICPPSLQLPHIADVAFARQMRPVSFDRADDESLPAWFASLPSRPTVYVTLGTVFNRGVGLFQQIIEGLRDQALNVIVTMGADADPALLGTPPDNVHIARYIPQTLLFPRCDVVVSHGGSGTTLSALGHGLPLLTIPQGADQFRNAERYNAAGVGRSLMPAQVSPDAVRRDVAALLDEPSYRENAARVQREIAEMPSPAEVVADLCQLVAASR